MRPDDLFEVLFAHFLVLVLPVGLAVFVRILAIFQVVAFLIVLTRVATDLKKVFCDLFRFFAVLLDGPVLLLDQVMNPAEIDICTIRVGEKSVSKVSLIG